IGQWEMTPSRTIVRSLVFGLLAIQATLLLDSARRDCVVVDESAHVPAGLSHWYTGSFTLYKVNPPLPRMLAVLPILLPDHQVGHRRVSDAPGMRSKWPVGSDFARANQEQYLKLIRLG